MAPRRPTQPLINIEWAEALVGLSMKVPQNWWVGCSGYNLHDGKIVSFDVSSQKWNLLLDARDDDDLYLIAYDAVYEYADENHSTFHEYQLTYQAVEDGDAEMETAQGIRYTKTTSDKWDQIIIEDGEDSGGRTIDPIQCTVDEEFSVNITDEEVELLKDGFGEIRYEKVFRWCLARYGDNGDISLFEFQAARMRNYMRKRVLEEGYKPRYYYGGRVITGDHVARFYGACLGRMTHGGRSMDQIFSTRDILDAIPSIQAAMTKGALEDLTTCLHYSDDWEPKCGGVWDDLYPDPKVVAAPSTASHRMKHGTLENGYNKVCSVCCCCCCYYDLNRFLITFFPPFLISYQAVASYC
jgi:hypothetical protein